MDRLICLLALVAVSGCARETDTKGHDTGTRATTTTNTDTDAVDTACTPPTDTGRDFVEVSAASEGGCARRASGKVECWGYIADYADVPNCAFIDVDVINYNMALGLLPDGRLRWLPRDDDDWLQGVDAPSGPFVALWADLLSVCGLQREGDAICWGQTGEEPVASASPIMEVQRVFSESAYSGVTAWRDGGGAYSPHFGSVVEPVRDLDAYEDDVCVLDANGDLSCWGDYNYRRDENGNLFYDTGVWLEADAPDDGWYEVDMDSANVCMLDGAGVLSCINLDDDFVVDLPSEPLTSFSGASYGCGINISGEIVCWSSNGQTYDPPPER